MGWLTFPMYQPVKEWFKESWERNENIEVLDVAIVKYRELYAAIKNKKTDEVFAVIYLLTYSPKSHYNFGYKDMNETMGPFYHNCPERILKLLTPTDNETANRWREHVKETHRKRKLMKQMNGKVLKLSEPISFTNGSHYSCFTKQNKRTYAGYISNGIFKSCTRVQIDLSKYLTNDNFKFIETKIPESLVLS